ncbi:MAG: sigma factor-like helix-turn-helix DNA-binding protein, partial [Bdellovibrionia bacterium]
LTQNEIFSNETVEATQDTRPPEASNDDLKKLLASLPEDFRRPIELLKLEELSVEEVAAKLGLSPSAVKMRIHRGFKLLKKKAEKDVYEE